MKRDIAEEWIAKLRSGEVDQVQGVLADTDGGRCCLGVLCDMAVEEDITQRFLSDGGTAYSYGSLDLSDDRRDYHTLPLSVQIWAGIGDRFGMPQNIFGAVALTDLNDNGKTFAEIADVIEANVENL